MNHTKDPQLPRPIPMMDMPRHLDPIRESVLSRLNRVFDHGQFIHGPEVEELELKLSKRVANRHCITVSSGTDALLISAMALGLKPGDEVITTPFTFAATAEVLTLLQVIPVLIDIDPLTFNLDPSHLKHALTPKTKGILPVSLYGLCAEMDSISQFAKDHNLWVLEDAAQSFGATYRGLPSGALSEIASTSFFPSKPLGGMGDGGAVFCKDPELAQQLKQTRSHGQRARYEHVRIGINCRLDSIKAAILLSKLEILDDELALRKQVGARYLNLVSEWTPFLKTQSIPHDCDAVYAQFTLRVPERDIVRKELAKRGISTAVHYPTGVHNQPAFQGKIRISGELRETDRAAREVLSLPMHPYLTVQEQECVIRELREACLRLKN